MVGRWGWVALWLPRRYPRATIDCTEPGYLLAKSPVRKNVAATFSLSKVARIDGSPSQLAPASKVSATTFFEVGITSTSLPSKLAGSVAATVPVGDPLALR